MHLLFEIFDFSFVVVLPKQSTPHIGMVGKSALDFCLTVRTPQDIDLVTPDTLSVCRPGKFSGTFPLPLRASLAWSDHGARVSIKRLDVGRTRLSTKIRPLKRAVSKDGARKLTTKNGNEQGLSRTELGSKSRIILVEPRTV